MLIRAEMKAMAKEQIRGNVGILFAISLVVFVIVFLANLILNIVPLGGLVATIVVGPAFVLSINRIYLNLTKDKKPELKDAFTGFDDFWSAFKVQFFVGLYTSLWSLLFLIPGIVKSYSYALAPMILAENKGMSANEAITLSRKMMDGHKFELFVLYLSFIGWNILACFTLGLLYIWLMPYMYTTFVNFYNNLKTEEASDGAEYYA